MDKFYEVSLCGQCFKLPVMKISDKEGIAVFDMLSSRKMAKCATESICKLAEMYKGKVDVVLSAESKGIILADRVAGMLDCDMVILRKEKKLYYKSVISAGVDTYTNKRHELFLDASRVSGLVGKRVLVVDDVVSTGSSLSAMETIMDSIGAKVEGKLFVFAEGNAYLRSDVKFVGVLPILKEE
jgi:adenine phosphoribosyltransferase